MTNSTETDINYPLIEAGGKWKIVSLDAETVRIMSANFVNVQDEITQSLSDMENQAEGAATTPAPSDNSDGTIDMTNEKFTHALYTVPCYQRSIPVIPVSWFIMTTPTMEVHLPALW